MACTANKCSQGRRACPCPDACRLADREGERRGVQMVAGLLLFCSVGIVALLAAIVLAITP
jgi:hypothetical protein